MNCLKCKTKKRIVIDSELYVPKIIQVLNDNEITDITLRKSSTTNKVSSIAGQYKDCNFLIDIVIKNKILLEIPYIYNGIIVFNDLPPLCLEETIKFIKAMQESKEKGEMCPSFSNF